MSESMSSPWIRDYLVDVAETHGAQLHNAPSISSAKKKVQLTDFLTYQENSYIWAWISDKDHRVSVRISKSAADTYKTRFKRNIFDCRFSVVIITCYRPMFSPRPLGPNTTGNTPVSHLSLEVEQVGLLGVGGHLFGSPRDLESDENVKAWVLGLRQDGGGGNVLKLRRQLHNKKHPPSPPHPPPPLPSLNAPVSQCQVAKAADDTAKTKTKLERPQDFNRVYYKRWRAWIGDPLGWDPTSKAEMEEPPNLYPTPHRTPSPTSKRQQQGTPTDWSPSNRGSPDVPEKVAEATHGSEVQRHDEADVLPTPLLLSDTEERLTVDTVIASDTCSLQPPTPAQRVRRSPPPASTPLPRSSPEAARSLLPRSQQSPCSLPPPPSSSLPPPPSFSPIPQSIRKNIQRKVPPPGLPAVRSDSTNQGSPLILVPNSDTSGAGSSQSQPSQRQLLSHPPAFPSSLVTNFEPLDASTPIEAKPGSLTRRTSKIFAEPFPSHRDTDEEITSKDDKYDSKKPENDVCEQEGLDSPRPPPAPSDPKIEVLEVGTSDTEEETEQLRLERTTARRDVGFHERTGTRDTGNEDAVTNREDDQGIDKVEALPRGPLRLPAPSVTQHSSSGERGNAVVPIRLSLQSPERPGTQSSMHSLFSVLSEVERFVPSQTPGRPTDRKKEDADKKMSLVQVARHDSEAWKEPSFIARSRRKGKARAVEEPETPSEKVGEKRQRAAQSESSVKRAKPAPPEAHRVASIVSDIAQRQDLGASASGKTHSSGRPSTTPTDATETPTPSTTLQSSRPRLASFAADFERIDLGKRMPVPVRDMEDIRSISLRTGRIRTLGKNLGKEDGSVFYIVRE